MAGPTMGSIDSYTEGESVAGALPDFNSVSAANPEEAVAEQITGFDALMAEAFGEASAGAMQTAFNEASHSQAQAGTFDAALVGSMELTGVPVPAPTTTATPPPPPLNILVEISGFLTFQVPDPAVFLAQWQDKFKRDVVITMLRGAIKKTVNGKGRNRQHQVQDEEITIIDVTVPTRRLGVTAGRLSTASALSIDYTINKRVPGQAVVGALQDFKTALEAGASAMQTAFCEEVQEQVAAGNLKQAVADKITATGVTVDEAETVQIPATGVDVQTFDTVWRTVDRASFYFHLIKDTDSQPFVDALKDSFARGINERRPTGAAEVKASDINITDISPVDGSDDQVKITYAIAMTLLVEDLRAAEVRIVGYFNDALANMADAGRPAALTIQVESIVPSAVASTEVILAELRENALSVVRGLRMSQC